MRWCLLVGLVVLAAGACGNDDDASTPGSDGVVVSSFQFPESELLGEIYAQALEDEGVAVRRELALGSRELVLPALRAGLVDVVPEYAGSALDATGPSSATDDVEPTRPADALHRALAPWDVAVLEPAQAANENVVAVTTSLAVELGLTSVSDLAPHAPTLRLGGPPECPRRPRCLPGLEDRYGLRFASFVPLDGGALVTRALGDEVIDVAVLFRTDPGLADRDVTALVDDRDLQPPDPVVPVARTAVLGDARVAGALDEVSAELTTDGLRLMNWRLANAETTIRGEARGWLLRHGLIDR